MHSSVGFEVLFMQSTQNAKCILGTNMDNIFQIDKKTKNEIDITINPDNVKFHWGINTIHYMTLVISCNQIQEIKHCSESFLQCRHRDKIDTANELLWMTCFFLICYQSWAQILWKLTQLTINLLTKYLTQWEGISTHFRKLLYGRLKPSLLNISIDLWLAS